MAFYIIGFVILYIIIGMIFAVIADVLDITDGDLLNYFGITVCWIALVPVFLFVFTVVAITIGLTKCLL